MIRVTVKDKDNFKNYNRALNFLGGGEQLELEVGLLEGITDPDVIYRGAVNEVGYAPGNIPERAWFRTVVDDNAEKYLDFMADALRDAVVGKNLDRIAGGGNDVRRRLGALIAEDLKSSIEKWSTPPNKESTRRKKGFNDPLVETGALVEAPTFRMKKRQRKVR